MTTQELINAGLYMDAFTQIENTKPSFVTTPDKIAAQYNIRKHDVFDPTIRKMKSINKAKMDDAGNPVMTGTGANRKPVYINSLEEVTRVGLSYQELIVDRRVGFMCGNPIELELSNFTGEESKAFEMLKLILDQNKIQYKNIEIAKALMSECEVAEFWYLQKELTGFWKDKGFVDSGFTLRCKVLKTSDGITLLPEFDDTGDLISFTYKYRVKSEGKEVERAVYTTKEAILLLENIGGKWQPLITPEAPLGLIPNPLLKIPVIYYYQPRPEWDNVQTLIDQYEKRLSNLGDENDYFGSPLMFMKGNISGFAAKGERGKLIQGDTNADVKIISWDNSPESTKTEFEKLEKNIFALTHTPDISFDSVKGNIGNISGIALKMLFLDAHLAVKLKEQVFGEGLQRRINLLLQAIGKQIQVSLAGEAAKITVKPIIVPYLPENTKEDVETVGLARQMGIISLERALELNPLVSDPQKEKESIDNEKANEAGTFNLNP